MTKVEGWRNVALFFRRRYFNWVEYHVRKRTNEGAKLHGDVFKGDPLEHAVEEAVDLLFYLRVAMQRNMALEVELNELRKAHRACLLKAEREKLRPQTGTDDA